MRSISTVAIPSSADTTTTHRKLCSVARCSSFGCSSAIRVLHTTPPFFSMYWKNACGSARAASTCSTSVIMSKADLNTSQVRFDAMTRGSSNFLKPSRIIRRIIGFSSSSRTAASGSSIAFWSSSTLNACACNHIFARATTQHAHRENNLSLRDCYAVRCYSLQVCDTT